MRFLRALLDKQTQHFEKGGRLERLYPLWEAQDTFLYTPGEVTRVAPHVRDALDMKRLMITVVIALAGCIYMALYNTGYQANFAIAAGAAPLDVWQTRAMGSMGLGFTPDDPWACLVHGALYFVPVLIVTFVGAVPLPHPFPLHPAKLDPPDAVAVSVTTSPLVNASLHIPVPSVQLMLPVPPLDTTVPVPRPVKLTVRVCRWAQCSLTRRA